MALTNQVDAHAYIGRVIEVNGKQYAVDESMANYVRAYVDNARGLGGNLLVEQKLSIEHLTGEAGATGTADSVIILGDELVIRDLKYGRGVHVDAANNKQLVMYASAALREYSLLGDFTKIRVCIDQPRLAHASEAIYTVEELAAIEKEIQASAAQVASATKEFAAVGPAMSLNEWAERWCTPSEEGCRWCRAKAACPALGAHIQKVIGAEFDAIVEEGTPAITSDTLPEKMAAVGMIEDWCKAVRAEVERRLLAGEPVTGYKLVEGRRGARKWADAAEAEAVMRAIRLKVEEMFDLSLISPTSAEKLTKTGAIGPRQWPRLQALIVQSNGSPSVAPVSDKRAAIEVKPSLSGFNDISTENLA
jgi:hypothetical protein